LLVDCQRTLVQQLGFGVATLFGEFISIFVELYRISKALRCRHCRQYHKAARYTVAKITAAASIADRTALIAITPCGLWK
jgi:hypothetical protein